MLCSTGALGAWKAVGVFVRPYLGEISWCYHCTVCSLTILLVGVWGRCAQTGSALQRSVCVCASAGPLCREAAAAHWDDWVLRRFHPRSAGHHPSTRMKVSFHPKIKDFKKKCGPPHPIILASSSCCFVSICRVKPPSPTGSYDFFLGGLLGRSSPRAAQDQPREQAKGSPTAAQERHPCFILSNRAKQNIPEATFLYNFESG